MNNKYFSRYLTLLDVDAGPPTIELLNDLVLNQMQKVPFENISKLYFKKHRGQHFLPTMAKFMSGMEQHHFGGTCYTLSYYFYRLLQHLGYEVGLYGASMNNPDIHLVIKVFLNGDEFVVDTGYAAPFSHPLPCDQGEEYIIKSGEEEYILRPKETDGRVRLDMLRNGERKHGYVINPEPRQIKDFTRVISASYDSESTFMNSLLLSRFKGDTFIRIHNYTCTEATADSIKKTCYENREDLSGAIEAFFFIPHDITLDALTELQDFGDSWT